MAHYIQDYLYTEIPESFVTDVFQWLEVTSLPVASGLYENTIAVMRNSKGEPYYYLCEKSGDNYSWKPLFVPQSDIDKLNKIVKALEKSNSEMTVKVEQLEEAVKLDSEGQPAWVKWEHRIVNLEKDLAAEKEKTTKLQEDVKDLQDTVGGYDETISDLKRQVLNYHAEVERLRAELDPLKKLLPLPDSNGTYKLHVDVDGNISWIFEAM